jgi:condensation domain-containing protein
VPLSYQQSLRLQAERAGTLGSQIRSGASINANPYIGLRLPRHIETAAVRDGLDDMSMRHDVIGTRLLFTADAPMQVFRSSPHIPLEVIRVSGTLESQEHETQRLGIELALSKFDYANDVLARARLIQREADAILILTLPHIVSDNWSLHIIKSELSAALLGKPTPQAEFVRPQVRYGDFVLWQREWLRQVESDVEEYCATHFEGLQRQLLTERRRSDRDTTHDVQHYRFGLDSGVVNAIWRMSIGQRVTPAMILCSAYNVALRLWSGIDDVLLKMMFAGRKHAQLVDLVGYFANFMPIRINMSGNPTVRQVVALTRESVLDAYSYQAVPFALFDRIARRQGCGELPFIFGLNIVDFTHSHGNEASRDYQLDYEKAGVRHSLRSYLSLVITRVSRDSIQGAVLYRVSLLDVPRIRRFVAAFEAALAHILSGAECRVSEILEQHRELRCAI